MIFVLFILLVTRNEPNGLPAENSEPGSGAAGGTQSMARHIVGLFHRLNRLGLLLPHPTASAHDWAIRPMVVNDSNNSR